MTILVTRSLATNSNSFNLKEIGFWRELAASLLFEYGEDQNLTSSFRPPGGPTPTRGFFLPRATQAGASFSSSAPFGRFSPARPYSEAPMDREPDEPIPLPR